MTSELEYKKKLQDERKAFAIQEIEKLGYSIALVSETEIHFEFTGENVVLFPFTGWHTGKSITDGRGIKNLLKQIK